ncbi:hypothetical protein HMPREF9056_00714 [Actinomyces sp. oral taxon 170 str. F0386]|nr:hypothetical protein HMPREF9056_00714 [Actinomyces sp. oral taxon 170 str. F0386]
MWIALLPLRLDECGVRGVDGCVSASSLRMSMGGIANGAQRQLALEDECHASA